MNGTKSNRHPSPHENRADERRAHERRSDENWSDEAVEAILVDFFQSKIPVELRRPTQKLKTAAARSRADVHLKGAPSGGRRTGFISLIAVSAALLVAFTTLFNSNSSRPTTSTPDGLTKSVENPQTHSSKGGLHGVVDRGRLSSDRLLPAGMPFLRENQIQSDDPNTTVEPFFPGIGIEVFRPPSAEEGRESGVKSGKRPVPRKP